MAANNSKRKGKSLRQKEIANLGRRKRTVLKKVYELGEYDGVDVALILRHNGRLFTYRSIDHESWPPSMKEIVRLYHSNIRIHTKVKAASFVPCS
jgi:SRF-type transcription factor (DNA-binding and dimerisation domain)